MINAVLRCIAVAICVAAPFSVLAGEVVFQAVVPNPDGTSYCWTNTANWVGGNVPGYNDTWVFDPGAGNTLDVTVPTRAGSLYYRFAGIKVKSAKVTMFSNARTIIAGGERGYMKLLSDEQTGVLIGAQLMCERASDMIGEFSQAIAGKQKPHDLLKAMRPHPTFEEAMTEALTNLATPGAK